MMLRQFIPQSYREGKSARRSPDGPPEWIKKIVQLKNYLDLTKTLYTGTLSPLICKETGARLTECGE